MWEWQQKDYYLLLPVLFLLQTQMSQTPSFFYFLPPTPKSPQPSPPPPPPPPPHPLFNLFHKRLSSVSPLWSELRFCTNLWFRWIMQKQPLLHDKCQRRLWRNGPILGNFESKTKVLSITNSYNHTLPRRPIMTKYITKPIHSSSRILEYGNSNWWKWHRSIHYSRGSNSDQQSILCTQYNSYANQMKTASHFICMHFLCFTIQAVCKT